MSRRRGRGTGATGRGSSFDEIQAQISTWNKVAEPLRICGRLSVIERSGEDVSETLEELERSEAMLRVRLHNADVQTARVLWIETKQLMADMIPLLTLPLTSRQTAEQSILCWATHITEGWAVKEVGRRKGEDPTVMDPPWASGEKTVRERMWIATEQSASNVTISSLPGLAFIADTWLTRFNLSAEELSDRPGSTRPDQQDQGPVPPIPGDESTWIADITIPDDTCIGAGMTFTKTWRIKNTGTVPWIGRYLTRIGGNHKIFGQTTPPRVPVPDTFPGQEVDISVEIRAPKAASTSISTWKMTDELGRPYFPGSKYSYGIYCRIVVEQEPPPSRY